MINQYTMRTRISTGGLLTHERRTGWDLDVMSDFQVLDERHRLSQCLDGVSFEDLRNHVNELTSTFTTLQHTHHVRDRLAGE